MPRCRIVALLTLAVCAARGLLAQPLADAEVNRRVEALLRQMTLDEKIGQLNQLFYIMPDSVKPEERARRGQIGSFLFVWDPAVVNRLQRVAMTEARLHIPLLFGLDVVHGFRTVFPSPLAMAASWDPALVEEAQTIAANEASAVGIRWTFAPMVDIARDPRWGRIVEGAGEDPYLGAAMARAQVRGFQGPYVGSPGRLLACVKHFAGYGAAVGGRDYDSSYIPEEELENVYLPPFRAARDAGAATFMSAYMDLNDVPATGNRFLLQDVLRRDWGFRGFVVSDAFAVRDLTTHGFARDAEDAAFRALMAGVDMDMGSKAFLEQLARLVDERKISVAEIENSVRPVLEAKIRLGLFEHPYADEGAGKPAPSAEYRQRERVAAQRTMVLLRNDGSLLPLDKSKLASVAVIGPLADTQTDLRGSWAFVDDPKEIVTVVQGIRNTVGSGVHIGYSQGVQIARGNPGPFDELFGIRHPQAWTESRANDEFNKAVDLAKQSDVAVMVLGELEDMIGESASRSSIELPGRQEELLKAVTALGKPVVLVLVSGRPLDLSWASEHVPAIVEAWYPGVEGGNAVADILFGDANPGGKLPITWPRNAGQIPIYYAHNLTHQPESAPGFTSRYWDLPTSPLYPFGYGLSYTTFHVSNLQLGATKVKTGQQVSVMADVENTGRRAGDAVLQLYIHQQAGSASRPVRQLKGFQRVALAPGEKKTVRFSLGRDELSFWSPQTRQWVEEPEMFDVWVGEDSTAELHAGFQVIP